VRLLCLIDSLVPYGAEQSLVGLVPRYVAQGMTVDVGYLLDRPGLQAELTANGAQVFCLDGHGGRAGWLARTRRLVLDRQPDLIHTSLFEADLAGRIAGLTARVPVVSSLTGLDYGPEHLGNPGLKAWKVRAAQLADMATARGVVRFHAVANHVAEVMSMRLRVPRSRIDVVVRGRDPAHLGRRTPERTARTRARIGLTEKDTVVLAVARHDFKKGLDLLLRAFGSVLTEVPEAKLLVAGREGDLTSTLREMTAQLGVDGAVRLLGPRSDVPDLLAMADAFVIPSRSEGFPGVLLEAMALEAPIVASDIPAVREIVGGDDIGMLVPGADPDALANAICTTLADPDGAVKRSRLARERFLADFTLDRTAEQMLEFYRRALAAA
jgi:glycosyltransferase involved in cell wall biosynthesis